MKNVSRIATALCSVLLSVGVVTAQDTATVTLGGDTDLSCQTQPGQIPTLTGGVRAAAVLDYAYDRSTGVLTLTVTNTSPDVVGESNPVITEIGLNLPRGAVTGASLTGQAAPNSTVVPDWSLTYALDGRSMNCFGEFDVTLQNSTDSPRGGIANGNASNPGGPPGSQVIGPVTFTIQLSGTATQNLNAHSIAYGFSSNGSQSNVNAAMKFQAGGQNGDESGVMATGLDCTCASFATGPARLGTRVEICQSGQAGCHDCVWISGLPGPTYFGAPFNLSVDIGLPLLTVLDADFPNGNDVCYEIAIPNDPQLNGFVLYFAVITHPNPLVSLDQISSCGPLALTITN